MRRFLFAVAVLAGASAAWANDLPPIPKTIPVTVTAIIKEKAEPAPTPAKVEKAQEASCDAPMPPVPAKSELGQAMAEAKKDIEGQAKTCRHALSATVKFVANECLRKPIYDVQKALNDLEGRGLCNENCRLNNEAERLSDRAGELAEKAKQTCPCDLHTKLRLLKEESEYAKKANKLAVKRARWECKRADHQQQTEKLKAKHVELFHCCD